MNRDQVWKNFDLGQEIDISGTFIYNGLRCFHQMKTLDNTGEVFEFLDNLSVGLERLLKVAVILLEHDGSQDQERFEQSLITQVRNASKAAKVFQRGDYSFVPEDILWKELLVFFMNTRATSGLLDYLRSISPLEFDAALAPDYLQSFQSEEGKQRVMGELEELYGTLEDAGQRHVMMGIIGNPNVDFDSDPDFVDEPADDDGDQ